MCTPTRATSANCKRSLRVSSSFGWSGCIDASFFYLAVIYNLEASRRDLSDWSSLNQIDILYLYSLKTACSFSPCFFFPTAFSLLQSSDSSRRDSKEHPSISGRKWTKGKSVRRGDLPGRRDQGPVSRDSKMRSKLRKQRKRKIIIFNVAIDVEDTDTSLGILR